MFESGSGEDGAGPTVTAMPVLPALLLRDPGSMAGADLVDGIAESERLMSAVTAWQLRAMAALAVPGVAGDPHALAGRFVGPQRTVADDPDVMGLFVQDAAQSMAAGEVAAMLRISPVTAGVRVREAIRMATELPDTLHALAQGRIDRGKARVIAEHTAPLPVHLCERVQAWVLPIAETQSTAATRKAVSAAVIAVDPRGAQERHEQARRERGLMVQPGTDGMSNVKAYLAADGAVGIFQLADLLATHTVGFIDDDRSIGARRVDALADLAGQILTHGHVDLVDYLAPDTVNPDQADSDRSHRDDPTAPTAPAPEAGPGAGTASRPGAVDPRASRRLSRQGRRPHLQVTLAMSTLAGLDDLPAHLAGHGAITAGMARSIATSAATVCALLADPTTGAVMAAGSRAYRPSQDLRDTLAALADECRFPSCRQPSWRCDIDHRDPYDHRAPRAGGPTVLANTDPLCRRHHLFKHHADWTLRRDTPTPADPSGLGVTWTSPTGHVYRDPARQVDVPAEWTQRFTDGPQSTADSPDRIAELIDVADAAASDTSESDSTHSETRHSQITHSASTHSVTPHCVTTDAEITHCVTTDAETTHSVTTHCVTTDAETTHSVTTHCETTDAETTDAETTDAETTDAETTDAECSPGPSCGADPRSVLDFLEYRHLRAGRSVAEVPGSGRDTLPDLDAGRTRGWPAVSAAEDDAVSALLRDYLRRTRPSRGSAGADSSPQVDRSVSDDPPPF